MLCSCEESASSMKNFYGFEVDNTKPLDEINFTYYSKSELENYFLRASKQEFGKENKSTDFSIATVNEKFPIECLRENENSFYSVYAVDEGGYFYIFWVESFSDSQEINGIAYISESDTPDNAVVGFSTYLSSSNSKPIDDFNEIKEQVSTFSDVYKIDPNTELSFSLSSRTVSYSLLDDDQIMCIEYKNNDVESNDMNDLMVTKKTVAQKGDVSAKLSAIFPDDLP